MAFKSLFRKVTLFTIANVYMVILAGGVVRCTGSGMGCPDWPKCFGSWVPPTNVSELPDNYQEIYSHGGKLNVDFNAFKTWTEYINRLLGVFVGFSIFMVLIFSIPYFKINPPIFYCSLSAFFLVGLQGWIGAKVVATNLKPFMVTIHMVIALIIVAILLYAFSTTKRHSFDKKDKMLISLAVLACSISLIQIISGTQVRQMVDIIAIRFNYSQRSLWANEFGGVFFFHRIFAYLVIGVNFYLAYKLNEARMFFWRNIIIIVLVSEFFSGLILVYFALPNYIQPLHLLFASLFFGIQFYISSIFISAKIGNSLPIND